MMNRPFNVVTHKRWLAEQFAPLGAVLDHGFDIDPTTALDTYWWAPGAWVASAHRAGVQLPLLSCGVDWLPNLSEEYLGRRVWNSLLRDIPSGVTAETFVKLPEVKHDGVPAKLYGPNCYLRETLEQYHLPADTIWQLQEPMEFYAEARYWIVNGEIAASSLYRVGDTVWGSPGWDSEIYLDCMYSAEEMDIMARRVARTVDAPPGYVLDIGMTEQGPCVVEANAAWSSGPYDGDPAGIFEAIKASHDFEAAYPRWAWRHSPVFDRARPLKIMSESK